MRKIYFSTGLGLATLLLGCLALMSEGSFAAEKSGQAKAIFAGGCFWCMEEVYEKVDGVISVTSGYTGGHVAHPTYEESGRNRQHRSRGSHV